MDPSLEDSENHNTKPVPAQTRASNVGSVTKLRLEESKAKRDNRNRERSNNAATERRMCTRSYSGKQLELSEDFASTLNYDLHKWNLSSCDVFHGLPHFQQHTNWDCGIACIAMCLKPSLRDKLFADLDFFRDDPAIGFGTSVWTIDLCYLLAHVGVPHKMYTVSLGVDPKLEKESFYGKITDKESQRVQRRILDCEANGIEVEQCQLSMENVLELLRTTGPLIVLVNHNMLQCNDCSWGLAKICKKLCCTQFLGHFVLLIGYDLAHGVVYYLNPANAARVCLVLIEAFDSARTCFGTDYDLIAIRDMGNAVATV